MSTVCSHIIKTLYRQGDASRIKARHPPSRGRHKYYLTESEALADITKPKRFVASGLANYPKLLSTFLATQLLMALRTTPSSSSISALIPQHHWDNRTGKEAVIFLEKLRGLAADEALAARQQAEDLAVGGLRDALQSFDKLIY